MRLSRRGLVLGALLALTGDAAADTTRVHLAPEGPSEHCQLLVPFPFAPPGVELDADGFGKGKTFYRGEDAREVAALCAIDLHAEAGNAATAAGVCPKIHGTQPGIEIYELDGTGLGKAEFESRRCKIPGRTSGGRGNPRKADKLAKYKTAVYGWENQSMLFYFHFSRLLGNLAHVQPATYRTVSAADYRRWAGDAIARLKGRTQPEYSPLQGWAILHKLLDPRTRPRPRIVAARARLFVPGSDQLLFGTLMTNPRGEHERDALCLRGDKALGAAVAWRKFNFFRLVASRRPLSQSLHLDRSHPRHFREELQRLACARDFTDMVILDHVFNQLDRMGNVHQKSYHHYIDADGRLSWKKEPGPADDPRAMVPLVRLVLKDNDDGLKWKVRGQIVLAGLLRDIRHLDPTVYERIQWLAGLMRDPTTAPTVRTWFIDSARVSAAHYDEVRLRFLDVAAAFKKRHDAGELHLDLDLEAALRGDPAVTAAHSLRSP